MSTGKRRERIEIKRKARTERDDGGYDTSLVTIQTRWASVVPQKRMSRTEVELAGALRGTGHYEIEMDARGADVRAEDVIVWKTNGGLVMNVREVRTPDRRTLPLLVIAEYGVPNSGT